MKFCDKLQKIRKDNNITQEGLADKLNVSRQAVSKWESGLAYPDTEKLIQISKIFNVSLDELINDNKNSNQDNKNKKLNFMEILNKGYNFISEVFSMFWAMKFSDKCKFILELIGLFAIIYLTAGITTNIISVILDRIFVFLPRNIVNVILNLFSSVAYILWLVIAVFLFIKVIKTRYLDYYVIIKDDNVKERIKEEPIKELKERKDYKIVIRDPKNSSFNILSKLGKLFIFGLKILGLILLMPIVCFFIGIVIALIFSLMYISYGLFFNGITISLLGLLVICYLVIEFIFNLLFNKKLAINRMFIMFIIGLLFIGSGIGFAMYDFSNFEEYHEDINYQKKTTLEVDMHDNLVFRDIKNLSNDRIVIDNNIENIKLDILTNNYVDVRSYVFIDRPIEMDKSYNLEILGISTYQDELSIVKKTLEDMKEKKIKSYNEYDYGYEIDKIYISNSNLTKLKENYKKYYE